MDDFYKFVSNMEQITAMLGEFSRLIAAYHNGLTSAGVETEQAIVLTKQFQTDLMKKIFDFIYLNKSNDQE